MLRTTGSLLAVVTLCSLGTLPAKSFKNGDFAEGKSPWLGDAQVVSLKADGTVASVKGTETAPAAEIKLSNTQLRDLSQKFKTEDGSGVVKGSVVYKASPDFKINEKSTRFSKEITWGDGTYYWSALVFPKSGFCVRLDKADGYCYRLTNVKPGGDWETLRFAFEDVGDGKDVTLRIIAPPGTGSLFIKSVTID